MQSIHHLPRLLLGNQSCWSHWNHQRWRKAALPGAGKKHSKITSAPGSKSQWRAMRALTVHVLWEWSGYMSIAKSARDAPVSAVCFKILHFHFPPASAVWRCQCTTWTLDKIIHLSRRLLFFGFWREEFGKLCCWLRSKATTSWLKVTLAVWLTQLPRLFWVFLKSHHSWFRWFYQNQVSCCNLSTTILVAWANRLPFFL